MKNIILALALAVVAVFGVACAHHPNITVSSYNEASTTTSK